MKNLLPALAVLLLSLSIVLPAQSQSAGYLQQAYTHIASKYGLDATAVGDLQISKQYVTSHNQVVHVQFVQTLQGTPILGSGINMAFLSNGTCNSVGHNLFRLDKYPAKPMTPSITAGESITRAAATLGQTGRSAPTWTRDTKAGIPVYDKSDISLQDIPVELGYIPTPEGQLRLVYRIYIQSASLGKSYLSTIDATSGDLVSNDVMTLRCHFDENYLAPDTHAEANCDDNLKMQPTSPSGALGQYRVLPVTIESPNHGSFQLLTGVDDPNASPLGWHDANGVAGADFTIARGNNVHAFPDRNWDYFPDNNVSGGNNLIFDFPYDDAAEPLTNVNAAVTNLFYWNNIMHDFAYQYGFDEAAGNFQEYNYTSFGEESDYVEALAQFGANDPFNCGAQANGDVECKNNSDFSTPPDGFNGTMRMFIWDRDNSSKYLDVIEPADLGGKILTGLPEFGADITTLPVTGQVIEINDGSFEPTQGCNPVTQQPELAGKIALIDRGVCDFSLKVYNAQEAGAIGAIICNFEDVTIPMGAGENAGDVTIPSVFISSVECERIRVAIGTGLVVSLVAPEAGGPATRDGSFDNSVISHEYAHGISTRLTGVGCLSPNAVTGNAEEAYGMGEGWSDFFALVTTVQPGDTGEKRRGIGTYANKESTNGRGIRSYPYSTDMTVNPHTYDAILTEVVPHGVGSVWCAMLWDMYWALTDVYGWDADLYHGTGGNNIAIQLVMDGLKLQPCNPSFADARDAILEADQNNNGGANQCLIWQVFARRGLGVDAEVGESSSRADGREGFKVPTSCLDELQMTKSMTPEVIAGDNIEVTLKINNYKDQPLSNVFIEDPIPAGCTYVPGSANIEPSTGNTLVWSFNNMNPDQEVIITYQLRTDPAKPSIRLLYDDIEGIADERWNVNFDPMGTITNFWSQQDSIVHSGVAAWRVGDVGSESKHYLENYDAYTISGNYPVYRFYTYYNTETGADGGFLEISTAAQPAWKPLQDEVFRNGYPRKLQYTTFAIPNLKAYSGLSSADKTMRPSYIDLRDYKGAGVKIRYRFGTDAMLGGDGWYVDDVEIMDAVLYNSTACITSDQTDVICAEAPERGTIVDTQIPNSTDDHGDENAFTLMPNPAGDFVRLTLTGQANENAVIRMFDLTGHMMSASAWNLSHGENDHTIRTAGIPAGLYVVQVQTLKGIFSKKFVKE